MDNLGQMGLAMDYVDVSILVSLTSIWRFCGRILSGSVSEYFIKKAATPRLVWNAASQILMLVGYILMAMAMPGSLYIGSLLSLEFAMEFVLLSLFQPPLNSLVSSTMVSSTMSLSSTFPSAHLYSLACLLVYFTMLRQQRQRVVATHV